MKKAISIDNLLNKKFKLAALVGAWLAALGLPELSGVWIIWGHSGNGKTSFAMQLAKMLTQFGKVAYVSMEEKARRTMQLSIIRHNMKEVKRRFVLLEDNMEELKERLSKPKSPNIILIDSFQYTGLNKREYIALKEAYPKKLFIFISHADGKNPEGRAAKFVRYDADIKMRVEVYKMFPVSRFGGGEPFTIWEEGAKEYWGEITE
jgi:molybdopterin-guanine dinucleotide biosynthesis protein